MRRLEWRLFLLFYHWPLSTQGPFITNKIQSMFLPYSWSGSQRVLPPVEHLGVSHRQHKATLSSVQFRTKLHPHEEDDDDFASNHLYHTCGLLGNLSPSDQSLGNGNTAFFLSRSSISHPLLCRKTPCNTTPHDRNCDRENIEALHHAVLSPLQQYVNFRILL